VRLWLAGLVALLPWIPLELTVGEVFGRDCGSVVVGELLVGLLGVDWWGVGRSLGGDFDQDPAEFLVVLGVLVVPADDVCGFGLC